MGAGIFLIIVGVFIVSFGIHSWCEAEGFGDLMMGSIFCWIVGLCITIAGIFICCNAANPDSGHITCTKYNVDQIKTEKIDYNGDTIVTNQYVIHYKK